MILIWLWKRLNKTGARPEVSGRLLRRFPEADIAKLLKARILIEDRKVETWGTCAHCDCGYDARIIHEIDGKLVACCPFDPSQDVILEPNDLMRYRIDAEQLIAAIAAAGKLTGTSTAISAGLWSMGTSAMGRSIFLCRSPRDVFAPGISMLLKSLAGSTLPIVVFDETDPSSGIRLRDMEIDVHELDEISHQDQNGIEKISFDTLVPPGNRVRLTVHRSRQAVTLDGRVLDLPSQMLALVRLFVEQAVGPDPRLKKQEIEINTGREAKEIIRDLRNALIGCGLTRAQVDELFVLVRGIGYRLALNREEIEILG
ncbi:hypothetical protein [Tateyamaria pelophila]|uniref:hypothetical protein n=1 Tax=Tateyamaria pelophila TaxID=328415 RepID=UPI001CBF8CBD|nr:hypothetical protein [Tateyamaria pelophila]